MEEPQIIELTDAARKRRMVWDIAPCRMVEDVLAAMEMTPGSKEGLAVEHQLSHARLNVLIPLASLLETYGQLAGEVVARVILESQEIEDYDEEDLEHSRIFAQSAITGALAGLIDAGVLSINRGIRV